MICENCGTQNIVGAEYCDNCGLTLPPPGSVPDVQPTGGYMPPPTTSMKALFSLIAGLAVIVPFASLAAIILGHMSRAEIRRSAGRLKGSGLALAGLILGYGAIAFSVILIAAVIIPNVSSSRTALKTGFAIGRASMDMTLINGAEQQYVKKYPEAGYACSLGELSGAGGSKDHAGMIDTELASGEKHGYVFELSDCEDHTGYTLVGYPKQQTTPPLPSFCADQTGVIKSSAKGTAEDCLKSGKAPSS